MDHICKRDAKCNIHDDDYFPSDCKSCKIKCVGCLYSCSCVKYRKRNCRLCYDEVNFLSCDHCFDKKLLQCRPIHVFGKGEITCLEHKQETELMLERSKLDQQNKLPCSICNAYFDGVRFIKLHDVLCAKCIKISQCEACGSVKYERGFICEEPYNLFLESFQQTDDPFTIKFDYSKKLDWIKKCLVIAGCSDCKATRKFKCNCGAVICNNCPKYSSKSKLCSECQLSANNL